MRDHYRENKRLRDRHEQGDKTALWELIKDNLGLVYAIGARLMRQWRSPDGEYAGAAWEQHWHELIEAGLDGLVEGAMHVGNCPHDNIGGYLARWIRGAMLRADPPLIRNLPKPKPGESRIRVHQELDRIDGWKAVRVWPDYLGNGNIDENNPVSEFWGNLDREDAIRLILWLCRDALDREIIDLRLAAQDGADRTLRRIATDVAETLGLHPRTARRRLSRIRRDFVSHRRRAMSYLRMSGDGHSRRGEGHNGRAGGRSHRRQPP